jgi:hypothetical protein
MPKSKVTVKASPYAIPLCQARRALRAGGFRPGRLCRVLVIESHRLVFLLDRGVRRTLGAFLAICACFAVFITVSVLLDVTLTVGAAGTVAVTSVVVAVTAVVLATG